MSGTVQQRFRGLPGPGRPPRVFKSTGETMLQATTRLGLTEAAIRNRLSRMGERQALSMPRDWHPKGKARPGVYYRSWTKRELRIVSLLSRGLTPRHLYEHGLFVTMRAAHLKIQHLKLKLGAFTTAELTAEAVRRRLIP